MPTRWRAVRLLRTRTACRRTTAGFSPVLGENHLVFHWPEAAPPGEACPADTLKAALPHDLVHWQRCKVGALTHCTSMLCASPFPRNQMQSHCDGTEEPSGLASLVIECLLPGPESGRSTTWHYMQSITFTYTPNKVAFPDSLTGPCARAWK